MNSVYHHTPAGTINQATTQQGRDQLNEITHLSLGGATSGTITFNASDTGAAPWVGTGDGILDLDLNEKWQLSITAGSLTGGTYQLSWNGGTTSAINWNDNAAAVQTAMEGVTGSGNISVTGDLSTTALVFEFIGAHKLENVSDITIADNSTDAGLGVTNLQDGKSIIDQIGTATHNIYNTAGPDPLATITQTGAGEYDITFDIPSYGQYSDIVDFNIKANGSNGSPTIVKTQDGQSGIYEIQTLTLADSPTGGTWKPDTTTASAIAWNADHFAVASALTSVVSQGSNGIAVSGSGGGPFTCTWQDFGNWADLSPANVDLYRADTIVITPSTTQDGGGDFSEDCDGTILLSGDIVSTGEFNHDCSGTILLSGDIVSTGTFNHDCSGTILLSGDIRSFVEPVGGTILLSGNIRPLENCNGTILLSGDIANTQQFGPSCSGTIVLSGNPTLSPIMGTLLDASTRDCTEIVAGDGSHHSITQIVLSDHPTGGYWQPILGMDGFGGWAFAWNDDATTATSKMNAYYIHVLGAPDAPYWSVTKPDFYTYVFESLHNGTNHCSLFAGQNGDGAVGVIVHGLTRREFTKWKQINIKPVAERLVAFPFVVQASFGDDPAFTYGDGSYLPSESRGNNTYVMKVNLEAEGTVIYGLYN